MSDERSVTTIPLSPSVAWPLIVMGALVLFGGGGVVGDRLWPSAGGSAPAMTAADLTDVREDIDEIDRALRQHQEHEGHPLLVARAARLETEVALAKQERDGLDANLLALRFLIADMCRSMQRRDPQLQCGTGAAP